MNLFNKPTSYLSPKLKVVALPEKGGTGVIAQDTLHKGELAAIWSGVIMDGEGLAALPEENQKHSVQIAEDHYLVSVYLDEPADSINHSCDANLGMLGQICLVAMRDISPGEEVTIDYAMVDTTPYDEFECACGSPNCRGAVTGDDWQNPDLWEKYAGYFAPHVQAKIDTLKTAS